MKTTTALQTTPSAAPLAPNSRARDYARASKSENTLDAYDAAWSDFNDYCADKHRQPLPATPETLIDYITFLAEGQRVSTIELKLAAIAYRHRLNRLPSPTEDEHLRAVIAGIRRELGVAPEIKQPVTLTDLRAMVAALPDTLTGQRDRAVILIGWAGAFRRSELVALDVGDVQLAQRLTIRVRKSKTDQEGAGMVKVIPPLADQSVCALVALRAWLAASGIKDGPLFRSVDQWGHIRQSRLSDKTIALIVKAAAISIGMDPGRVAGHSLRSGFISEAASAGVESRNIMAQTGHKTEAVMRAYIQDAGLGATAAVKAAFRED